MNNYENEINKLLEELESDPDFVRLDSRLNMFNFMEIFKISTTELAHSSFLAWLLNPLEEHGLGDYFLKNFLEKCINKINENKRTDIEIPDINELKYKKVIIKTEELIRKKPVDITIRFPDEKFFCLIENKIKQKETNKQTETYAKLSKKKYLNYKYYWYIFLTKSGEKAKSEEFISFSYHDIKDLLEQTVKTKDKILKNHNVIFLLEQIIVNIENNILDPIDYPKTCQDIYKRHKKTFNEINATKIKKMPYKKAIDKINFYNNDYISPLKKKIELDLNEDWKYDLEPKNYWKIYKKQWFKNTEDPFCYYFIAYWNNNGLQNIGVEFHVEPPKSFNLSQEFTEILDKSFKENKPEEFEYRNKKIKFKIVFSEGTFETDEDLNNVALTMIQLINSTVGQIGKSVMSFKDRFGDESCGRHEDYQ